VFSWLDGAAILTWISMYALVLGGFAWATVRAAARLAGLDWRRLALALVPLAGIGLFLGLSMMSATHLRAEGIYLGWLTPLRAALVAIGLSWSAWLGWQLIKLGAGETASRRFAMLLWLLPLAAVGAAWWLTFFVW
jgi:hypothetical protein